MAIAARKNSSALSGRTKLAALGVSLASLSVASLSVASLSVASLSVASLSAASLGLVLASHVPAQAQGWFGDRDRGYTYYEPAPVFAPPPYYSGEPDYDRRSLRRPDHGVRALLPGEVRALVARRGMRLVGPLQRNGRVYLADVRTRSGQPLRLVIDGYYGQVLQTFPGVGPALGPQREGIPRPPANIGRRVARLPERPERRIDEKPSGGELPPGAPTVIPGVEAPPPLQVSPADRVETKKKSNARRKTAARTPRPVPRPAALDPQPPIAPPAAAPALPEVSAPAPVEPRLPAQASVPEPASEPAPAVAAPPSPRAEPPAAMPVTPSISAVSPEPPQTVEPLAKPQASRNENDTVKPPEPARQAIVPEAAPAPTVQPPASKKASSVSPKASAKMPPDLIPLPPEAPVSIPVKPDEANLKRLRNSRVVYPGAPQRNVEIGRAKGDLAKGDSAPAVAPLDAPPVKRNAPVPVAPLN